MIYPPHSCTAGPSEELAEELIQTISGALSVFGSSYIVFDVLKQQIRTSKLSILPCFQDRDSGEIRGGDRSARKKKSTDAYQRIMLGLSFFDICHSFFDSFMGTWMTPSATGWWMAVGNQASCTAQGFFTAFGFMGSFGYQMALSLNILCLISFGWSQDKFTRIIEKPMHALIILAALIYAVIPLPLESYNPDCGQCLWAPLYGPCDDANNANNADDELCLIRGQPKLQIQYWDVFWAFLWLMLVFCTISMATVYFTVRRQEKRMLRYRFSTRRLSATSSITDVSSSAITARSHNAESRRIRKVLLLYTMALFFCWGVPFTIIFVSIRTNSWPSKIPFEVRAMCETLIPLCGFFNMLVYFLPKCLNYQVKHPGTWLITSYFHILFGSSSSLPLLSQCFGSCNCCNPLGRGCNLFEKDQAEQNDTSVIEAEEQKDTPEDISETEKGFQMNFARFNVSFYLPSSPQATSGGKQVLPSAAPCDKNNLENEDARVTSMKKDNVTSE